MEFEFWRQQRASEVSINFGHIIKERRGGRALKKIEVFVLIYRGISSFGNFVNGIEKIYSFLMES